MDQKEYYITGYELPHGAGIAAEDSIMIKGGRTTAGSTILDNFIAPFDAEAVERLRAKGIGVAGKTHMQEFGIISVDEKNKGGLSGAAQAVLAGEVAACLCNDLFGRYRKEAAQNNLCYIHPTYGTVSRYGLIPAASSMDQIGILCADPAYGFARLAEIAGNDPKDGAMFPEQSYVYQNLQKDITLGVPSGIIERADERTKQAIQDFAQHFTHVPCTVEYFDVCKQVMYILSSAEISNNINRYDGVKFGYRSAGAANLESLYLKTRTEGFGRETKLAAIMGAMALSADQYVPYYEKAMKLRRLIHDGLAFEQYDVMILPASISEDPYENLSLYALAPLAGLPCVSFSYKGCGMQLIARAKNESALLTAWEVAKQ